jgi:Protein of unknown function (DUF2905)
MKSAIFSPAWTWSEIKALFSHTTHAALTSPWRKRQSVGDTWLRGVPMNVPFQLGRVLVIAGVLIVGMGLFLMAGSRFSFFGFGRLPGDISYKGKNTSFYFPIVSCLILSAILTLVLWLISFLTRN